jgi:hypothetical protein
VGGLVNLAQYLADTKLPQAKESTLNFFPRRGNIPTHQIAMNWMVKSLLVGAVFLRLFLVAVEAQPGSAFFGVLDPLFAAFFEPLFWVYCASVNFSPRHHISSA